MFTHFFLFFNSPDLGPATDLIDPVNSYSVCLPPSPAPEDAALLVGLIPGVEKHLARNETADVVESQAVAHTSSEMGAAESSSSLNEQKQQLEAKDVVAAISNQFNRTSFVHPVKPQLKPTKVTAGRDGVVGGLGSEAGALLYCVIGT